MKTGDVIEGRYRIIKTLGAGGMGTVFLAEHALIKRRVAVKILHPELATDASVVERFMNEARAAGTLGHPNIVESTDMGFTHDHVPYIVFEYLEGTLLTDEIYRVGGLPVRRAVWVATQIASALEAAHRAGIVHRDLKSDNVFLTDKDDALDHVKVLDFGVSRFLEAEDEAQRHLVFGTPEFMSPEQITAPETVDKRADIYALGVILYEMLTARRPFSVDDDPRLLMHHIVSRPPPPLLRNEVPHGLSSLVLDKLLAKDRADRYQTMGDVQAALEQFITRGDGSPLARRRSAPIVALPAPADDDERPTSVRLPRPVTMRATPTPYPTLDTPTAVGQVALPATPPPGKRPYALYGAAAGGIVIGLFGLIVGLRGGNEPARAPAPVVQMQPAVATPAMPAAPRKIDVSLEANVPNARVVFRRRVTPAPVQMQINATDVIELVEVSAPGHKTTRYWLTFDRPTYLKAQLTKGSGSYEATEEETLVALGEVTMVTHAAASAVAKQTEVPAAKPTAKTIERAAKVESAAPPPVAPRKIGRAAVEAFPATAEPAAETAPAAEVEPAPVAELPAPPPVESTPTPEPTKVVEAPAVDSPKRPPNPVAIDIARPTLDRATVSAVIAQHRPEVLKCLAEGKKRKATLKGTLTLQLQVDAAGKVRRVQVQSTLADPFVAACVVKAANTWRFPARAGGELASVSYPFTIH